MNKKQEDDIYRRGREIVESGRLLPKYEGLTDEEALCIILPSVGYDEKEALFILDRARGRLVEKYIDENGDTICIVY